MKNRHTYHSIGSIILLLLGVLIISCNQTQISKNQTTTQKQTKIELAQWEQDIELNHGAPWKANQATSLGIVKMYEIILESTPTTSSDYRKLASDLNQEMNTLISKCTMTGPSHDNLHLYLEPLLKKLAELQETETTEKGKQLTSEINEHLVVFNKYFV